MKRTALIESLSTKVAARIESEIFNKVNPAIGLAALVSHKKPWIADTPAKVEAVNALGLAAPIRLGDQTPYWPIDKGYAKHA